MKYLFAVCCLLWATLASAQQSERFDEFELHYSIVYSTFLTADIAAQFDIPRGKDKAMLTLSVGTLMQVMSRGDGWIFQDAPGTSLQAGI